MSWYSSESRRALPPPPLERLDLLQRLARKRRQAQAIVALSERSGGSAEQVHYLVEIGADMWNPCQPCNDLAGLKRKFGDRISFSGGIDSQFVLNRPGVTEAEVRAEVRQRIHDLAPGGGYAVSSSNSVPEYVPLANFNALREATFEYGRYPIAV